MSWVWGMRKIIMQQPDYVLLQVTLKITLRFCFSSLSTLYPTGGRHFGGLVYEKMDQRGSQFVDNRIRHRRQSSPLPVWARCWAARCQCQHTIYGLRQQSLGKEGAEQHRPRCAGAAIQQQRPSQPKDLRGATWKTGSCSSLRDRGHCHHPSGYHGATVRTTLAFTAEKSLCHFVGAVALYHVRICKEGQKLDKSLIIKNIPLRWILNPGQLLKLVKTGTKKEVELPNLSSPPIQLVEKKVEDLCNSSWRRLRRNIQLRHKCQKPKATCQFRSQNVVFSLFSSFKEKIKNTISNLHVTCGNENQESFIL